uniref:Uncharacterized protein n=1 Tax=Glossina morsitans morsitans TaxID=37546 RepID=A0A1B0FQB4_GLOMM
MAVSVMPCISDQLAQSPALEDAEEIDIDDDANDAAIVGAGNSIQVTQSLSLWQQQQAGSSLMVTNQSDVSTQEDQPAVQIERPWSDKYGGRPMLLTTFSGNKKIEKCSLNFLNHNIFAGYLISRIIVTVLLYISSKVIIKPMVLNEPSLCAGMMIGNLLTGYICEAANAITAFSTSSTLLLYVYSESVKSERIMTAGNVNINNSIKI